MGQDSPEMKSRQAAGRQGTGRCKVHRQRAGLSTGAETQRCGQGQKAGQEIHLENNAGEHWIM